MALTASQRQLLSKVMKTNAWAQASPKERKALVEAGIVESGLRNLTYGDRDSKGFLQQRPSQGWANPTDVETATNSFLSAARQMNDQKGSAGDLAQRVQRSAFPDRYHQQSGQADEILGGAPTATAAKAKTSRGTGPADRRLAVLAYAQNRDPLALAQGLLSAKNAPETPDAPETVDAPKSSGKDGIGEFDGKKVAAWMVPVLTYARGQGWKGSVTSGFRTDEEQARIYNSGVRPAAKPQSLGGGGSNHSRTGFLQGAIDVTDSQSLAQILKRKHSRLQWAGPVDDVHFSVPSNGTY